MQFQVTTHHGYDAILCFATCNSLAVSCSWYCRLFLYHEGNVSHSGDDSKGIKGTKRDQKESKGSKRDQNCNSNACGALYAYMTKHLHLSALYPSHGHLYACVTKYSLCNSLFHEEIWRVLLAEFAVHFQYLNVLSRSVCDSIMKGCFRQCQEQMKWSFLNTMVWVMRLWFVMDSSCSVWLFNCLRQARRP